MKQSLRWTLIIAFAVFTGFILGAAVFTDRAATATLSGSLDESGYDGERWVMVECPSGTNTYVIQTNGEVISARLGHFGNIGIKSDFTENTSSVTVKVDSPERVQRIIPVRWNQPKDGSRQPYGWIGMLWYAPEKPSPSVKIEQLTIRNVETFMVCTI